MTIPTPVSDAGRVQEDVRHLAAQPRHREVSGSMDRARDYCADQLHQAGWTVTEHPFTVPSRLRIADDGKPARSLPMRMTGRLHGINLIARPQCANPQHPGTLLIAHLDTVLRSPGADDNASGVAVALHVARLLGEQHPDVAIALVDLEEIGQLGSRHLARHHPRPDRVICLESVGFYDTRPGAQQLPLGFGALFPTLAHTIRARDQRADFLAVAHRGDTTDFLERWLPAAATEDLDVLEIRDRRWNGAGQHLTRWVNPLLMDLDRSDHAPFWRQQVPALLLTGTAPLRNPHYHRDDDTPETLDYDRMRVLAQSLANALANQPPAPAPTP